MLRSILRNFEATYVNRLVYNHMRTFGAKGKAGAKGGGGPPAAASTYVEPPRPKTNF